MPILVLPKLFPPYYLRLTVITSIELGILFSAGDPEIQRGKLTCLKSRLGWWWQERDLNLGLTPDRCFWPRGHYRCVFPLPSLVSCLVSQLWWTGHKEVTASLKNPLFWKYLIQKSLMSLPQPSMKGAINCVRMTKYSEKADSRHFQKQTGRIQLCYGLCSLLGSYYNAGTNMPSQNRRKWLEDYSQFGIIHSEAHFYCYGESQSLPKSKVFMQRRRINTWPKEQT